MRQRGRRAPLWVREMPSREAHAILGRFDRDRMTQDLTRRQEWLYDVLVEDLEWRRVNTPDPWSVCSCKYCLAPF